MEEARQTESAWEVRLGIPEPELDKLSLASARPRRLRAWLDAAAPPTLGPSILRTLPNFEALQNPFAPKPLC